MPADNVHMFLGESTLVVGLAEYVRSDWFPIHRKKSHAVQNGDKYVDRNGPLGGLNWGSLQRNRLLLLYILQSSTSYSSSFTTPTPTITMAGLTFTTVSGMVNFGRSGYNKDGDSEDDKRNFGRSGYNKDDGSEDDKKNFGRSGYNKGNDDEDDSRQFNFGRSGYN
ncbi:hypothetical protein F4818DRAFT_440759 [Hypoxylon cercidicola]|nr:hypothetical protein F4818DRAFT_440759 [Hypoxylon cercidicola]